MKVVDPVTQGSLISKLLAFFAMPLMACLEKEAGSQELLRISFHPSRSDSRSCSGSRANEPTVSRCTNIPAKKVQRR